MDGDALTDPYVLLITHALLMVATWGVLVPVSVLIARFFKVTPGQNFPEVTDNPFWMKTHRATSMIVIIGSTIGAGFAVWALGGVSAVSAHAQLGIAVVLLGWFQLFVALQRGSHGGPWGVNNPARIVKPREEWFGDHYNMTRRRRIFEAVHISTGYVTVFAGLAAVPLGIHQFGLGWGWQAVYAAWLAVVAILYLKFTFDGRRIPTYQAIWGPSAEHPGNRDPESAG